MGYRGRKLRLGEALTTEIAGKGLHDLPTKLVRPTIVAQSKAGHPEVEIRGNLERKVLNRLGDGLRVLAERARFREVTREPKVVAHVGRDPTEPSWVTERFRQAFSVA